MTPRERQARQRTEASHALSEALAAEKVSQRELARRVGRAHSKVAKWACADEAHLPTLADLRLMPREVARRLLAWVGDAHRLRVVDEVDEEATAADYMHALAAVVKETADVSAAFANAIADDALTPEEARTVIREADEAIRAIEYVRAQAEAVAVSNVATLKRGR